MPASLSWAARTPFSTLAAGSPKLTSRTNRRICLRNQLAHSFIDYFTLFFNNKNFDAGCRNRPKMRNPAGTRPAGVRVGFGCSTQAWVRVWPPPLGKRVWYYNFNSAERRSGDPLQQLMDCGL